MTVVHLKQTYSKRTKTMPRGQTKRTSYSKEILFGLCVITAVIATVAFAAFNGGFSLEAGGLEMTLDASLTQGMQLSFASI